MDFVSDLARRIWEWLPARTDSRRVTLPHTIATALGANVRDVTTTLARMEDAGHVVRNRATGRQSGWHRGTPPQPPAADPAVAPLPLF